MERGERTGLRFLPLLVLAGTLALFLTHLPGRLYGDDVWFVRCIVQDEPFTSHFLYMPLARGWAWLGATLGVDPFLALRALAALGTAVAAALFCAAALRRGARVACALLFALAPVLAASSLFFATAAEIHGVHLGAAGLLAWCLARLHRDAPSTSVFGLGLAFGLFVGTHQSGALMLPGTLALYLVATGGRALARRGRDALAFGLAGLVSLALMVFLHWIESGDASALGDTTELLGRGLAGRAATLGWRELIGYLAIDGAAAAFPLVLVGAAGLGALLRRRPALAAALVVALLPYVLFFPLFHFPERGAYYVVCLPLLAGAALAALAPGEEPAASCAFGVPLFLALALTPWRPDELERTLGPLWPVALVAAVLCLGLVLPRATLARRGGALALGLVLVLQLVGSLRSLHDYDRERPLLDWTRAACETTGGDDALLITCGFQEYWLLVLLHTPWPEPFAATWGFAQGLPQPTPAPFLYGDPTVPRAQFEAGLAAFLQGGTDVLLDERVISFVESRPPAERELLEVDLEHIRRHHRLEPLEHGPFRARRILTAP